MKVLLSIRQMTMGGMQVNAVDLAAALRDLHGFEVTLFGAPGPMVKFAEQKGLRFLAAPEAPYCPSPALMRAFREAVRKERPDLIYVWDWAQCIEAYFAVYLPMRVPMVVTDMIHEVSRILPKHVPTTFGVPQLVDEARKGGRKPVEFLPPPVDVHLNSPGMGDREGFRARWGVQPDEVAIVTVSRLDPDMKTESLERTIDVVGELAPEFRVKLVITGDGESRASLEERAAKVNAAAGRSVVVFTGAVLDPRPAYDGADIFVGMGGSAMRAMAFAKPAIVTGKRGFAKLLTPETSESIHYNGNYGFGDGTNETLRAALRRLLTHPAEIAELGAFSREFVVRHFSMEEVSKTLAGFLRQAAEQPAPVSAAAAEAVRMTAVYLRQRTFLRTWSPVPGYAVES